MRPAVHVKIKLALVNSCSTWRVMPRSAALRGSQRAARLTIFGSFINPDSAAAVTLCQSSSYRYWLRCSYLGPGSNFPDRKQTALVFKRGKPNAARSRFYGLACTFAKLTQRVDRNCPALRCAAEF